MGQSDHTLRQYNELIRYIGEITAHTPGSRPLTMPLSAAVRHLETTYSVGQIRASSIVRGARRAGLVLVSRDSDEYNDQRVRYVCLSHVGCAAYEQILSEQGGSRPPAA